MKWRTTLSIRKTYSRLVFRNSICFSRILNIFINRAVRSVFARDGSCVNADGCSDGLARVFGALVSAPNSPAQMEVLESVKRPRCSSSDSSPIRPGLAVRSCLEQPDRPLESFSLGVAEPDEAADDRSSQPAFRPVGQVSGEESHSAQIVSLDALVSKFEESVSLLLSKKFAEVSSAIGAFSDQLEQLNLSVGQVRTEVECVRTAQKCLENVARRREKSIDVAEDRMASIELKVTDVERTAAREFESLRTAIEDLKQSTCTGGAPTARTLHAPTPCTPGPAEAVTVLPPNIESPVRMGDLTQVVQEELAKSERAANVVVRGFPLDRSKPGTERQQVSTLLSCSEGDITNVGELGSASPVPNSAPGAPATGTNKHPLLRVSFSSVSTKFDVYRRRFQMRHDGHPVFVNHDLTAQQRQRRQQQVPHFKSLRAKGIKCFASVRRNS